MKKTRLHHPLAQHDENKSIHIEKYPGYVIAAVLIVIGIFCIFLTDFAYKILPYGLGILMIVSGIFALIMSIRSKEYKTSETNVTSIGIIVLALGVVILVHNDGADSLIGAIWGMLGLYRGSGELNYAISCIFRKKPFYKEMVHSIIELMLAVILLLDPIAKLQTHLIILGLELCLLGVQWIYDMAVHRKE